MAPICTPIRGNLLALRERLASDSLPQSPTFFFHKMRTKAPLFPQ